jgi:hypothetical protein
VAVPARDSAAAVTWSFSPMDVMKSMVMSTLLAFPQISTISLRTAFAPGTQWSHNARVSFVWARETRGNPTIEAAAAPAVAVFRNFRRPTAPGPGSVEGTLSLIVVVLLQWLELWGVRGPGAVDLLPLPPGRDDTTFPISCKGASLLQRPRQSPAT